MRSEIVANLSPEVPDSITIEEFMNDERHGRHALATSKNPYTCGLTGKSYSASEVVKRTDWLARALSKRLGFDPHDGTEWDRVVALFSLNTVSGLMSGENHRNDLRALD